MLMNATGKEGRQRPRRRPEGRRQGPPVQPQEGAFPPLLPRLNLQPEERRQAPRDGLLSAFLQHDVRGGMFTKLMAPAWSETIAALFPKMDMRRVHSPPEALFFSLKVVLSMG